MNSCLPVLDLSEGKGSSTKSESSDPEGVLVSSQFSGIIDLFLSTSGAFGSCRYSGRSMCPFRFPKYCIDILTFHIAFLSILISVYSKIDIQTFVAVFFPSCTFLPYNIVFFFYIIRYSVRMLFIHVIGTNGNHFDHWFLFCDSTKVKMFLFRNTNNLYSISVELLFFQPYIYIDFQY